MLHSFVTALNRGGTEGPPGPLARVISWTVSAASLALGLTTLFVFRRGLPHVSWIVGYLLLVVLLVTVLAEFRAPLEARGQRLVVGAGEYLLQSLCHGLFLFVLPAYYAAATLTSPNAVVVVLLAAAALLTTIDPWYRAVIHPRLWLRCALLWLAIFAGLNVALALLGARPIVAAVAGAGLSGIVMAPALRRPGASGWLAAAARSTIIAATAAAIVWLYPLCIPPAPMFMARTAIARDVAHLEPIDVVGTAVESATVQDWGSLTAFTAVYAPAGMQQTIEHVWQRDGVTIARIPLAGQIVGGRREGFRTFSRRSMRGAIVGRYQVDVMTTSGQLVGRIAFTVTR